MCDTIVSTASSSTDGVVWFAKNSDREPGEAQVVEHHPAAEHSASADVALTYLRVPQVRRTHAVILSRPFWMWGAEMGANEHGVCIGNEAVFTRLDVPRRGVLGMDLLRLTLERAMSADDAVTVLTTLLEAYGQGGGAGYRNRSFRYHNSFLIADPHTAWIVETADVHWAARRVDGVGTISNVLTIGEDFDRISDHAVAFAQERGWCQGASDFDFSRAFGSPVMRPLTGGDARRAATHGRLCAGGEAMGARILGALRHHAGSPLEGHRSISPCAHASWLPTRHAAQTVGSMVAQLAPGGPRFWFTGTSSPCLSVFKPFGFGALAEAIDPGPAPAAGYDDASLWWRHERLHRAVLRNYSARAPAVPPRRDELERDAFAADLSPAQAAAIWATHRAELPEWTRRVERERARFNGGADLYWAYQNRRDAMP